MSFRLRVSTPLQQILVLTFVTTPLLFPHGTVSSLARRATQEGVNMSAQAHETYSEVKRLQESFAHVQTALDQVVRVKCLS